MSEKDIEEELPEGIIELVDDDGKVIKFKLVGVTEYKGEKYTVLLPAEENNEVADDEVVIFRFDEKNAVLQPVEDEALLEEVFEFFQNEEEEEDGGDENPIS